LSAHRTGHYPAGLVTSWNGGHTVESGQNDENHPTGGRREGPHVVLVGAGLRAWPLLVPVAWWFGTAFGSGQPAATTYRQLVDQLQLTDLLALGSAHTPDLLLKLRIRPTEASATDSVTLRRRDGTMQTYRVDRFGAVDLPLDRGLYESNPALHIAHGVRAEFAAQVRLPLEARGGRSIPASAVERALRQYGAAASAAGWRYWLSAPKWASVVVRIAGGQSGCRIVGGSRRPVELPQNGLGEVRIDLIHIWTSEVRYIECASPIEEVLLEWRPA
jgi:hypothetical protein